MNGNQFTEFQNMRVCQYKNCKSEWDYKESGMGTRKYCKHHSIVVRRENHRRSDRVTKFNMLRNSLFKNYVYFTGDLK